MGESTFQGANCLARPAAIGPGGRESTSWGANSIACLRQAARPAPVGFLGRQLIARLWRPVRTCASRSPGAPTDRPAQQPAPATASRLSGGGSTSPRPCESTSGGVDSPGENQHHQLALVSASRGVDSRGVLMGLTVPSSVDCWSGRLAVGPARVAARAAGPCRTCVAAQPGPLRTAFSNAVADLRTCARDSRSARAASPSANAAMITACSRNASGIRPGSRDDDPDPKRN